MCLLILGIWSVLLKYIFISIVDVAKALCDLSSRMKGLETTVNCIDSTIKRHICMCIFSLGISEGKTERILWYFRTITVSSITIMKSW